MQQARKRQRENEARNNLMRDSGENTVKVPELLSPAGNYAAFVAAVENGADAVYLGVKDFNARQSAQNFSAEELSRAVEYAHVRKVSIYAALNILLDNREIGPALQTVFEFQSAGVDGIIVQDIGLLNAVRKVFPSLRIHASTQMTVHNPPGVTALAEMGVRRVVLARELGLSDIQAIREQCPAMELELFAHGALCYSYSGQCLMSSVVGGRSGNRGRCAQPCRLAYTLRKNQQDLIQGHLLSPADLCMLEVLPEMAAAGITSLKIEGRMKRPEYVAVVTRVYRRALDRLKDSDWLTPAEIEKAKEEMASVFNRRFTLNQWQGKNKQVLSPSRPNNRGMLVGRVEAWEPGGQAFIKLSETLRVGDGIEVWVTSGQNPAAAVDRMECGQTSVTAAEPGAVVRIPLPGRAYKGDRVFRTHDAQVMDQALESMQENREEGKLPVRVSVRVKLNEPLLVIISDGEGNQGKAESVVSASEARKVAISQEQIIEKVGRMGNTPFKIASWHIDLDDGLSIPFSEMNETRRKASESLLQNLLNKRKPPAVSREAFRQRSAEYVTYENDASNRNKRKEKTAAAPKLSVRTGDIKAAEAAFSAGADRVYLAENFIHTRITSKELAALKESAAHHQAQLYLQIPSILRSGDDYPWKIAAESGVDGLLAGDLGGLFRATETGLPVQADYTLNPFNSLALAQYKTMGADGVCLSPELNLPQLRQLEGWTVPAEYVVHGHQPIMVTEHCVIGGLLEKGCTHCRQNGYELRDAKGYGFPVKTDRYCRMHLFNARQTSLFGSLPELIPLGLAYLRIDGVLYSPDQVQRLVGDYRSGIQLLLENRNDDFIRMKEEIEQREGSKTTRLHLYRGVLS